MKSCSRDSIFTNCGLTPEGGVWWEDMTRELPKEGTNWLDHKWTPESREKMAHPNARFTAPITNCPILDPAYNDPEGVPISAILFGGRRSNLVPLVRQAFDWKHGVFLGASCCSETTFAVMGQEGKLTSREKLRLFFSWSCETRSFCYVTFLWLQYGGLFPTLARYGKEN
jgi:phosphoenolpyruvate carboxykinase (GTP)